MVPSAGLVSFVSCSLWVVNALMLFVIAVAESTVGCHISTCRGVSKVIIPQTWSAIATGRICEYFTPRVDPFLLKHHSV